ncbi:MAG TPA: GTP 3',8-cyclase MoaA [Rhodospirillales bacterium]|nr:GTP 3',8-cyclase MoaA [Rhodospirillales bacterium]
MIDPFGRKITYLRVSVTGRCNFRCSYCMSEDAPLLPREDLLSLEEMDRLCGAFIKRGVRKLRITGGEPLVRRNVMSLIASLGRHLKSGDLDEMTLTTNASRLSKYAAGLYSCGVRRVNVSLDTLDKDKFREITRHGDLDKVLDGIMAAKDAGLKVKINAVALKGVNDMEAGELVAWCGEQGFDISFIETMPLGAAASGRVDRFIPLSGLRARLERAWTLEDIKAEDGFGGPSRYAQVAETGRRVGFITPLSRHFCETCNRVRLTCIGTLYLCLGRDAAIDLRGPLRASESDEALSAAIDAAIAQKPKGHDFVINPDDARPALARNMNVTGG